MTQRCPKCSHVREPDARVPEWQCPACGVAYAKAASVARSVDSLQRTEKANPRSTSTPSSFWATLPGKAVIVAVIALTYFGGKTWLGSTRAGEGNGPMASAQAAEIEIYTTSYCETCKVAKAYMKRQGIGYTEYDVEGDIERRREFYARGGKGTPLIFVRGQRMEGFDARGFEQLRGAGRS